MSNSAENFPNRHVFVSGKNWKLSLAELLAFLDTSGFEFQVYGHSRSFFVLDTDRPIDPSMIDHLGGIIKIGALVLTIPFATITDVFLKRDKQSRESVKQVLSSSVVVDRIFSFPLRTRIFGVSVYVDDNRLWGRAGEMQRFLGSCLKKQLAFRGERSDFMGYPKTRERPQLTHVEVLKKGLVENSGEVLFCVSAKGTFLAKTIGVHNPFDFQKRDVERPRQRSMFSIPPRLARIMVNFTKCRGGSVFLDPFCGVGTILQEAALAGAEVIGVDTDPQCVAACKLNLDWLRREYHLDKMRAEVHVGDARRLDLIKNEAVDCIATEPDLGPPLRHFPTQTHAQAIVTRLQPLYEDFLAEAYRVLKLNGQLTMSAPWIKTRDGDHVSMRLRELGESQGLRIVYPFERTNFKEELSKNPSLAEDLVDVEERHRIGRAIYVFAK